MASDTLACGMAFTDSESESSDFEEPSPTAGAIKRENEIKNQQPEEVVSREALTILGNKGNGQERITVPLMGEQCVQAQRGGEAGKKRRSKKIFDDTISAQQQAGW